MTLRQMTYSRQRLVRIQKIIQEKKHNIHPSRQMVSQPTSSIRHPEIHKYGTIVTIK